MRVHEGELPRARRLASVGVELSRAAQVRLGWMDCYRQTQNYLLDEYTPCSLISCNHII
jgi:hypothetical protein